jgi:hypothetical protein
MVSTIKQLKIPLITGVLGSTALALLYFGIVSWAESPQHALDLFWEDRLIVIPILLGFGVQAGLYAALKKRIFIPTAPGKPAGPLLGAGGGTSTAAMVACCAHHVTDVLPILGLSAAAAFLAEYRTLFMLVGLATNLIGILVMLLVLVKERRKALLLLDGMPSS